MSTETRGQNCGPESMSQGDFAEFSFDVATTKALLDVAAAGDQDAVTAWWEEQAERTGFVYSTVRDVRFIKREPIGGTEEEIAVFEAWPALDGEEGNPAFEQWLDSFPDVDEQYEAEVSRIAASGDGRFYFEGDLLAAYEAGQAFTRRAVQELGMVPHKLRVDLSANVDEVLAPAVEEVARSLEFCSGLIGAIAPLAEFVDACDEQGIDFADDLINRVEQPHLPPADITIHHLRELKAVAEAMPVPNLSRKFHVGQRVRKVRGYQWPGVVVAAFDNLDGDARYVVECTVDEVAGALHIYNADQLEAV